MDRKALVKLVLAGKKVTVRLPKGTPAENERKRLYNAIKEELSLLAIAEVDIGLPKGTRISTSIVPDESNEGFVLLSAILTDKPITTKNFEIVEIR